MKDKGITTAICTKEPNYIKSVCISEPKKLYLLFWVSENDRAKNMFRESAQTRATNIENLSEYKKHIHKVHVIGICSFNEISENITSYIEKYGGKEKAKVAELGFFSHSGKVDGPIIKSKVNNKYPLENGDATHMSIKGWNSICDNWASGAICVFYGCNSARMYLNKDNIESSFSREISNQKNFFNVTVIGQIKSAYPSTLPDRRYTTSGRTNNVNWEGPDYMVGSSKNLGSFAQFSMFEGIPAQPMGFFKNGQLVGIYNQSIFNTHIGDK